MLEKTCRIIDVIHGTIYLSNLEKSIISTALFNRLHYVSQTSTVYLTYPSNHSKRFDHSIGTMKLCGDIFFYSIANTELTIFNNFITDLSKYINKTLRRWENSNNSMPSAFKAAYGDDNLALGFTAIEKLEINDKLFSQYIPNTVYLNQSIKDKNVYLIALQAIRVAGLLHDLGHPPFSHIVEQGLLEAYNESPKASTLRQALNSIYSKKIDLHESIGKDMLDNIIYSVLTNLPSDTPHDVKFFYILSLHLAKAILSEERNSNLLKDLHRIIAGALDGDRLDNISRDTYMTGLEGGVLEYQRIINSMILQGNSKKGYLFCPSIKTLASVENCFYRRWRNYRCMTHHHKVIKTNYMLQQIVFYMCKEYYENEKKGSLQNNDFLSLPYDISGLWLPLIETVSQKKKLIRLIQWNDDWLMTILQKRYLELLPTASENNNRLYYFLEEIIESKKNYISIIKRYEDFTTIDQKFSECFAAFLEESSTKCVEFLNAKEKFENDALNDGKTNQEGISKKGPIFNVKNFIFSYQKINTDIKARKNEYFLISRIAELVSIYKNENLYKELAEPITNALIKEYNNEIDDCFLVPKKLKTGTNQLLDLYDESTGKLKHFNDISHIDETLHIESSFIPEFYVYIKWKDSNNTLAFQKIRTSIGQITATVTEDYIKNNFLSYLHNDFEGV